ncbi:NUDIX hydrolase [Acidicapsa ligni]|uniref:NUDIX hydrolase n=1 Tax=Acidicapsa ligni TaxID=542300 RepID=UPI0021E00140|nr:NUDIX hydrolase [Acidicapsa ligni]
MTTRKSKVEATSQVPSETPQKAPRKTPSAKKTRAKTGTTKTAKATLAKKSGKNEKVASAKKLGKKIRSDKQLEKAAPAGTAPAQTEATENGAVQVPAQDVAKVLDTKVVYQGPLFRVQQDHLIEPGGRESHRDIIKHNGSVVILAVDPGKHKKDPWIVIERQYRHAAGQFLWELPAGKLDAGEKPIDGAKRELSEETGYGAKKWSLLVEYFASPGFLGESMKVFLAEGLIAGDAHPEEDEHIDFRLVKLSDLLDLVEKGKIIDGKTLTSVLLYARQLGVKRKK